MTDPPRAPSGAAEPARKHIWLGRLSVVSLVLALMIGTFLMLFWGSR